MAKELNKTRIRDSRLLMLLAVFGILFGERILPATALASELIKLAGYFMVTLCAMGRLYASAFIGGLKNQQLVTYGPFSVTRNPLYVFSLIGFSGLALMSGHLTVVILISGGFWFMYKNLIQREEEFLKLEFGQGYIDYTRRTPRFWPNFKAYFCPDEITCKPKYLIKAFGDAIWWFLPLPLLELIDYFHATGALKTFFYLP